MRMHEDTRKELARLLELVDVRLAGLPAQTYENRLEYRQAVQALEYDLEQEGARFGAVSGGNTVSLAGVRASSTMGTIPALRNWREGVSKRIGAPS